MASHDPVETPALLPTGERIGQYLVMEALGGGGQCQVVLAQHVETRAPVAIKLPRLDQLENRVIAAGLRSEGALLGLLEHNLIPKCLPDGVREEGDLTYILMQYIPGVPFADLLRKIWSRSRHIDLETGMHVVREAAAVAAYLHSGFSKDGESHVVVHMDLSAKNLLVTGNGGCYVVDFGVAASTFMQSSHVAGTAKGTVRYMPPEQLLGEPPHPTMDIYGIGTIMWEIIEGRQFRGNRQTEDSLYRAVLSGDFDSITRRDVPAWFSDLCMMALDPDPARRPKSGPFFEALEDNVRSRRTRLAGDVLDTYGRGILRSGATISLPKPSLELQRTLALTRFGREIPSDVWVEQFAEPPRDDAAMPRPPRLPPLVQTPEPRPEPSPSFPPPPSTRVQTPEPPPPEGSPTLVAARQPKSLSSTPRAPVPQGAGVEVGTVSTTEVLRADVLERISLASAERARSRSAASSVGSSTEIVRADDVLERIGTGEPVQEVQHAASTTSVEGVRVHRMHVSTSDGDEGGYSVRAVLLVGALACVSLFGVASYVFYRVSTPDLDPVARGTARVDAHADEGPVAAPLERLQQAVLQEPEAAESEGPVLPLDEVALPLDALDERDGAESGGLVLAPDDVVGAEGGGPGHDDVVGAEIEGRAAGALEVDALDAAPFVVDANASPEPAGVPDSPKPKKALPRVRVRILKGPLVKDLKVRVNGRVLTAMRGQEIGDTHVRSGARVIEWQTEGSKDWHRERFVFAEGTDYTLRLDVDGKFRKSEAPTTRP